MGWRCRCPAQKAIDKVVVANRAKKDSVKAEVPAAKGEAKADRGRRGRQVAPWKCGYCDSENPRDVTSCNSCGAVDTKAAPAPPSAHS